MIRTPVEALERTRHDVVVVGSGVGGSRVAMEMAEAGARCLVLEAGPELRREELPLPEPEMISRLYWHGGLELSRRATLVFTRGRCVGGGSVVNQALVDRLDEPILARWRELSGVPWLTRARLAPAWDRAEGGMSIRQIPPHRFNLAVERVAEAMGRVGLGWRPLRRAETAACDGRDCMPCLGGCPHGGKQSTPAGILRRARAAGARVLSECTVERVFTGPDGVRVAARHGGAARTFLADRVVLAAGAMGTPALLLRSGLGRGLPRLGEGFHCHPQYLSTAQVGEPVDAHRLAFQGITADGPGSPEPRFKLETNFVPPIVFHTLFHRVGRGVHELADSYRHRLGVEICIRDREPGRLSVGPGGNLRIHKEVGPGDRAAWREAVAVLREVYHASGARRPEFSPRAFSVHPMGGCALGVTPDRGVVDARFRVHGEPRIRVADASLFPASTGRNPSLTVMALALRAADALVEEAGGTPGRSSHPSAPGGGEWSGQPSHAGAGGMGEEGG